jgi:hypothetical protein
MLGMDHKPIQRKPYFRHWTHFWVPVMPIVWMVWLLVLIVLPAAIRIPAIALSAAVAGCGIIFWLVRSVSHHHDPRRQERPSEAP